MYKVFIQFFTEEKHLTEDKSGLTDPVFYKFNSITIHRVPQIGFYNI